MNNHTILENYGDDDVIDFKSDLARVGKVKSSFKKVLNNEIPSQINSILYNNNINVYPKSWFSDGLECEVLKLGAKSWQKGKIKIRFRLSVEFHPDELEIPESPLDEMRHKLNQSNL